MEAVQKDDVTQLTAALDVADNNGVSLCDQVMREEESLTTVLHQALILSSNNTANHLINTAHPKLLLEEYEVHVRGVPSKKTCLHIMTENNQLTLAKALTDRLKSDGLVKELDTILRKTVLKELEGQRPRHLSAIHIAALVGNTEMVKFLVGLGVDPNTTNNKKDTPVLWAARGNHLETLRQLIEFGADLNLENDKGSTPLYWAVRYGFVDLLPVIINEGKANVHQRRKLGLVSPIVLSSAMGYTDIVNVLLLYGADVNTRITGGQQALHYAAAHGHSDIIDILVENKANVDDMDDLGNTPLLHAIKEGQVDSLITLVTHGANIDSRNKLGQNIWDYSIDNPDENLLINVIKIYKQVKRASDRNLIFPLGKTPLHIAAQKNDCAKIKALLNMGADARSKDQNGNTYYHLAAREDCVDVLRSFISQVDPNEQNDDGNTAMHLVCENGSAEAVEILINKANLVKVNKMNETPLHVAIRSQCTGAEVVARLVDMVVKANNWSCLDSIDVKGNTALHLAAISGRDDVIEALVHLNPKILNHEGESPLHLAAKLDNTRVLEEMLNVFNIPGKGLNIDQQNTLGESLLHICAEQGDPETVDMLIKQGADLSLKDTEGDTVLHALALKTVSDPNNKDNLLNVFRTIVHAAPTWWCIKKDLNCPDEHSELHNMYKKLAVVYLASYIQNDEGLNLICYATKLGAKDFLERLLNLPEVFRHKVGKLYKFDVTHLIPETVGHSTKKPSKRKESSTVGIVVEGRSPEYEHHDESCLDFIVELQDEILAAKILDISPLKQLVKNYWDAYQWVYGLLMLIHIAFMACFSGYSISLVSDSLHGTDNPDPEILPWILFVIWPSILFIFECYYIFVNIVGWCTRRRNDKRDRKCAALGSFINAPYKFFNFFLGYLSHITSISFSILVITWFILYEISHDRQPYVLCPALIIGWMFTISFTKGFQTVHAFSIMLKYIILRDITRFMFIYLFVLLAFSFGLHALFQIVPDVADAYASPFDTIFLTFNLMVGMGEIFDEEFDNNYIAEGSNSIYVKITYLFYVILATIILLNLLIAMMSDTYNAIKSREGTTWRIGSVRLTLRLERSLKIIPKLFRAIGVIKNKIKIDPESERYILTLQPHEIDDYKETEMSELHRLEERINHLHTTYVDMCKKVEEVMTSKEGDDDGTGDNSGVVALHPKLGRPASAHARRTLRNRQSHLRALKSRHSKLLN